MSVREAEGEQVQIFVKINNTSVEKKARKMIACSDKQMNESSF